jgi:uncharacterized protein YndB with AHSA1/START domain
MTGIIRQTVTIAAPPKKVYEALIDEKKHAKFTGNPATISRKVGGAFACYGDHLEGFNLELVAAKRIVQAWRSKNWPKGMYSIVTFALARKPGGKTRLSFTQVGLPPSDVRQKTRGWKDFYWKPLKAHLEK